MHYGEATIAFDRPERRNAASDALVDGLDTFLSAPPAGVNAVILTGGGGRFRAGSAACLDRMRETMLTGRGCGAGEGVQPGLAHGAAGEGEALPRRASFHARSLTTDPSRTARWSGHCPESPTRPMATGCSRKAAMSQASEDGARMAAGPSRTQSRASGKHGP